MQSLASKLCAGICSSHKQEPTGMSVEESEQTRLKVVFELLPQQTRKMVLLKLAGKWSLLS